MDKYICVSSITQLKDWVKKWNSNRIFWKIRFRKKFETARLKISLILESKDNDINSIIQRNDNLSKLFIDIDFN